MAGDPTRMSAADIEAARHLAASFPAISDESELRARAARLASAVRRMAAELKQAEAERDALKEQLATCERVAAEFRQQDDERHAAIVVERDALKAATDRVRRMAQVWVDIRPVHPTATREGHVMADAGEQVITALDQPTEESTDGA